MTYVSLDQARQQAGVKLTTTSSSSSGYVSLDQARQQAIQGNAGKKPVAPVKTQPIPPVIKITPNQTNIYQKPQTNIFQNAQKELQKVVKVGTDTVLSFVKPKQQVKSPVPKDQVINKNVAQQQPQATPILKIAPDQKKLTPMQLEQVQPASAQMRITPKSIEAQKQTVAKGTKFITDVKNTQTFKTMEDLKIDPLQFKANPKKAVDGFLTTVKDALTEEKKRINDFIKVYQNLKSSDSEKLGAKINLVSGTANVVFSPLTGLFKAAEEIPVLATLSKVISLPFTAAGELSTEVSNKVVDALPISTKAKNDIKAPLGEMVALASQLIIGKVAEITPGKRTELVNKYGIEDANTIIKKARELAKDKMGRSRMNTVLPDGEYTPQQVMGKVIANGLENTPEGRTLVKTAVEAQQRGESVQVKNTLETIQNFEQNIQDYRSFGGYTVGTSVENAALRDIAGLSTKPEIIKHTQEKVKTAIESGEVKTNTDGTITLYRGGNPSTKNGLSSATYDKTIAQRFADNAGGVLHEFKVKPEDIQAFIGKAEKEVLVRNEKVIQTQSPTSSVSESKLNETGSVQENKQIKTKQPDTEFTSRVFERMKAENPDILTGDLKVESIKLMEDAQKAVDLIAKDKQKAYDVAMGKEVSSDVTATNVNIALAEQALKEGNTQLYAKLIKNRSLAQTRRGQEIVAEKGSIGDNSTATYVKKLLSARLEDVGKNYLGDLRDIVRKTDKSSATKVIDREVGKLEKKIASKKLNMRDALSLLDRLACV